MNLLTLILTTSALGVLVSGLNYLVAVIRNDGHDQVGATREPPRSHAPGQFDPRSRYYPTRTA